MMRALKAATGRDPALVWHADAELPAGTDLVALPGGFSYGDYLRCGAIAAQAPVMAAVRRHAARGGLVLGVCNGFQILCEARLLPGVLVRNRSLSFQCRDVHLTVASTRSPFTRGYRPRQVLRVPIAHGEGNYAADDATLDRVEGEGRVLFRYCDARGSVTADANPNGAARSIAGICDDTGRIVGLMPHPENAIEDVHGSTDGLALFTGAVGASLAA